MVEIALFQALVLFLIALNILLFTTNAKADSSYILVKIPKHEYGNNHFRTHLLIHDTGSRCPGDIGSGLFSTRDSPDTVSVKIEKPRVVDVFENFYKSGIDRPRGEIIQESTWTVLFDVDFRDCEITKKWDEKGQEYLEVNNPELIPTEMKSYEQEVVDYSHGADTRIGQSPKRKSFSASATGGGSGSSRQHGRKSSDFSLAYGRGQHQSNVNNPAYFGY